MFFGFTYGPHVCPAILATLTHGMEALGKNAERRTPVCMTADPERDTPQAMQASVSNCHPSSVVGFTGPPEQITPAAAGAALPAVLEDVRETRDEQIAILVAEDGAPRVEAARLVDTGLSMRGEAHGAQTPQVSVHHRL